MKKPYLFLLIALGVIVLAAVIYLPTLSRYHELKSEQEHIQEKIEYLDSEIRMLQHERDLLKNDKEYLEKVIREELGLVRPGEIVYKFIPKTEGEEKEAKKEEGTQLTAAAPVAPEPPAS